MNIEYSSEIVIQQVGILNGELILGKGKLFMEHGHYFIEVIGDSPFVDFRDTQSRFTGIIEIDEPQCEIFELTLLPDSEMAVFEVCDSKDFENFYNYCINRERKKLEEELPKKCNQRYKFSKI